MGYLILNRKVGERIRINDDIEIVVNRASHGEASIGIYAPKHVKIKREELCTEPRKEQIDGEDFCMVAKDDALPEGTNG